MDTRQYRRTQLRAVLRHGSIGEDHAPHGEVARAGVREDGVRHHPESGVVQGGVISPGLANGFLASGPGGMV